MKEERKEERQKGKKIGRKEGEKDSEMLGRQGERGLDSKEGNQKSDREKDKKVRYNEKHEIKNGGRQVDRQEGKK